MSLIKSLQANESVFVLLILACICAVSFSIRLFAVIRFESVIHEFDPYFNYRTAQYLIKNGFYEFWNWFDDFSWYPLGRVTGQTLFPGLMLTAACMYKFLHTLNIPVDIRDICVFTGPIFSALTAIMAFLLTKEVSGRREAGLLSALFMGTCPSYLSRSVAGSFDNEAVAIFGIVTSFYLFARAMNQGSLLSALLSAVGYLYMVASWGGYVFVTNVIVIYVLALILLDRFESKQFLVYSVWYVIGTLFALNIPFVNYNAVLSMEHLASHLVFGLSLAVYTWKDVITDEAKQKVLGMGKNLLSPSIGIAVSVGLVVLSMIIAMGSGKMKWAPRSMTLLDPTYASKHIPIIASVSEHQPTTWSNYLMDLYVLPFFIPVGLYTVLRDKQQDAGLLLGVYGILGVYFSGVMIRLLLVFSPAACCLAGIGCSTMITELMPYIRLFRTRSDQRIEERSAAAGATTGKGQTVGRGVKISQSVVSLLLLCLIASYLIKYVCHATSMSSIAYSSPSIVMSANNRRDGSRVIQDDFREAYYWLRMNTKEDAKILSWWDYGYQITAMSNRTVLVDNNTWNNTHIATVALILGSNEETALPLLKKLDVDYVLVLYGGVAKYPSDDINKFLWPVRIAHGVYPNLIKEQDFIGSRGYTVDETATEHFKNSLIYKLSYYRAGELTRNTDFARNSQIGRIVKPKHFTEAYTSQNWIVRIYKVEY
jgi:dolichyl-diphosphooligosaccharide---protein glycosyltransferase